jgi:hypothetical protein
MSTAASIDDLLGPASARFFGAGYRAVRHEVSELVHEVPLSGGPRVRGTAAVRYPAEWSTKGARSFAPHVSSIDAFVLGTQLAEVLLATVLGLGREERELSWVRSVDLRSGPRPQEDLAAVPLSAGVVATADGPGTPTATVEARVGTITVRLVVAHPPCAPARAVAGPLRLDELLGPASGRFHACGYASSSQDLADVVLDEDGRGVGAAVQPSPDRASGPWHDLGARYRPSVTFVDAIVGLAQLSEVLLYALDAVDRARSNTMWMRRVRLECPAPDLAREPFRTHAELRVARLLPLHGATWRAVDMTATYHRISARYALAHELPSRDATARRPDPAMPEEAA